MNMTLMTARVVVLALLVASCEQPIPPPVAQREPSLDADDIAVIRALLDDLAAGGRPGARLLLVDTTLAMCPRDPGIFGDWPIRCLQPSAVATMSEVVPPSLARTIAMRLPVWAAKPLLISGALGDDVTLVSPTLLDTIAPGELLRRYPPGSTVVWLSAIGYPAPGLAVIRFSDAVSSGAARIERQPDGRWRVAARVSHSIE